VARLALLAGSYAMFLTPTVKSRAFGDMPIDENKRIFFAVILSDSRFF
jgi:hypothetical protein